MTIGEITAYLESFAPPGYQESYDNAGLITGNPQNDVSKVLLCLDSTEEVVDEAIAKGCNLIVAHHPVIFGGLKKITGRNYVERVIIKAIKNDISIFAVHTNLDNVKTGVNAKICEKLGLVNCRILSPKSETLKKLATFCPRDKAGEVRQAIFDAGAGHIGNYSECSFNAEGFGTFKGSEDTNPFAGEKGTQHHEPEVRIETIFPVHIENQLIEALLKAHPYEEVAYDIYPLDNRNAQIGSGMIGELTQEKDEKNFLLSLKTSMKTGCVRHTRLLGRNVKRVAVCGGAGSFLLKDAINLKADVFITGDFKYHQFFDAEGKIVIADIGHYESEQFTVELLHDILTKKFNTFAILFSEVNTNPINYL